MKTFLRENKLRLLILGVPVLCLVILWSVNIYELWWDHLTPWENLGSPPGTKALIILDLYFPRSPYFESGKALAPGIQVYASDRRIYPLDSHSQWWPGEYTNRFGAFEKDMVTCARLLEQEWNIETQNLPEARSTIIRGECSAYQSTQYVIYQVRQDGTIWRRYLNAEIPDNFRRNTTFYTGLTLLVVLAIWIGRVRKIDPIAIRPDYEAK